MSKTLRCTFSCLSF